MHRKLHYVGNFNKLIGQLVNDVRARIANACACTCKTKTKMILKTNKTLNLRLILKLLSSL